MTPTPTPGEAAELPVVAKTAPERIFLIIGMDCPTDVRYDLLEEVTWCQDDIDGNGIPYVRADMADALREEVARLTKERDEWKLTSNSFEDSMNRLLSAQPTDIDALMALADAYADHASWAGYYSDDSHYKNESIDKRDTARITLRTALAARKEEL